jgi:hypothetical protein
VRQVMAYEQRSSLPVAHVEPKEHSICREHSFVLESLGYLYENLVKEGGSSRISVQKRFFGPSVLKAWSRVR